MSRLHPAGLVVALAIVAPADLPAQKQVITDDRPLPPRDQPDQDLTADDFRERDQKPGGFRLEFLLGCLFLVLVLVLSGIRKRRS